MSMIFLFQDQVLWTLFERKTLKDSIPTLQREVYYKQKSDVFEWFCEWKAEVEKLLGQSLKTLHTDNRGDFTSKEF